MTTYGLTMVYSFIAFATLARSDCGNKIRYPRIGKYLVDVIASSSNFHCGFVYSLATLYHWSSGAFINMSRPDIKSKKKLSYTRVVPVNRGLLL